MRKFAFLCLLILGTAMVVDGQGTLQYANPNPIPLGYVGNLAITGSGTNFSRATCGINLRLTHVGSGQQYNFGTAPTGAGWMPGFPWPTDTLAQGNITMPMNAPSGYYDVQLTGYEGYYCFGQVVNVSAPNFIFVGATGLVQGQVVYDLDSNCTKNGADQGLANKIISVSPGSFYGVTNPNGEFSIHLVPGTYTMTTPAPTGTVMVCPGPPFTRTFTVNSVNDTITGIDFFVKSDQLSNLSVSVNATPHRPGFSNCVANLTVSNSTFTDALNVVAKLVKPSNFTYNTFSIPPTIVNGDTATWMIGTLPSQSTRLFSAALTVPPNTPLQTPYTYSGFVTTSSAESNGYDNRSDYNDVVIGSFDPNDKQVWTEEGVNADGFILSTDTLLRYLIRFQNTGTDTAFNISIADQIDPDLDISSLSVEAASHAFQIQFLDSSGYDLKFLFPNILLPDSNRNEPASHGFIQYTIQRNAALPEGTIISNRGDIYFDFNQPVLTNTVQSKICAALGTAFTTTSNGLQVSFNAPPQGNPTTWQWDFGDGATSTVAQPTHTYNANGVYPVCLTIGNACGRSETICMNLYLGVTAAGNRLDALHSFTLAPNPAAETVRLEVLAEHLREAAFTLRDVQGKVVDQWNVHAIFGKYVKQLPVRQLAPGLYFLNLQSKETNYTVKLMVK